MVRCSVVVKEGPLTPTHHSFVELPRRGEVIFIERNSEVQSFTVQNVTHFAEDGDVGGAAIQLVVSTTA